MAHMSSLEKAKLQIKKLKQQKKKAQNFKAVELAAMSPEERLAYIKDQNSANLRSLTANILWDVDHKQLAETKRDWAKEILNLRMEEIKDLDHVNFMNEKEKIRGVLNDWKF